MKVQNFLNENKNNSLFQQRENLIVDFCLKMIEEVF
jgi:hypothetical protein